MAARPHDAFETTMRTLRSRLPGHAGGTAGGGAGGAREPWRADVSSCVTEAGDEDALDIDALRRAVRAEAAPLSIDAAHIDAIIRDWQATKDDKTFAMKTRVRGR